MKNTLTHLLLILYCAFYSNNLYSQCFEPTGIDTSLCGTGMATLEVTGNTGFYRWYNAASGQSFLDTGSVFITPNLTMNDTFYVAEFDTGLVNRSLQFDGTDDHIAIQDFNYAGTSFTELTVEVWLRTTDGNDQFITSFDRSEYWRMEVNGFGGGFGQIGFDVFTDIGQLDFGSISRIDDGNWHHIAGVFDNGTVSIYIDGVLDTDTIHGSTFGSGVSRFGFVGVGSEADVFNGDINNLDYFNGDIAMVRIWDIARSQAEIQQTMNNCLQGPQPGLQTDFQMDGSGSDAIVLDYSGNQYNGELQNFSLPGAWLSSGPDLYTCSQCESSRDTVEVEFVTRPSNFLVSDTCIAGNSFVLDAGSNYNSYLWQDNSMLQTFNVTSSGEYTVTVDTTTKYGSGCEGADTVRIFINPKPTGIDTSFCGQNDYQLRATGSNGLYRWYDDFNATSGIDTGKLDFTLTATDTFYVAGFDTLSKSDALLFNPASSNFASIENYSYSSTTNTELTVQTWIKTTNENDQMIASFDRSEYWRLEINGDGAGPGAVGFDVQTNAGTFDFGGTIRVDDGNWHHVAAVFDNGTFNLYIDGVLDNTASNGSTFGSGVTRFGFIGVGSEAATFDGTTGPNDYFDGTIADLSVWSRALSQTEIQSGIGNCQLGGEEGLELYYPFTDGNGTQLTDRSGNSRNAILKNTFSVNAWSKSGPTLNACPSECESERDTVIAILNITPKPNLGSDICASTTTTIDAGPNYLSYLWNTTETTQTISTDENNEGLFYVTVDSTGTPCIGSDTIFSNIILIPEGTDTNRCGPGVVELNANGGADYKWFDKSGSVVGSRANVTLNINETDTFTVSAVECDTLNAGLAFDGVNDYVALDMFYNTSGQVPELTVEAWVNTNFSSAGTNDNWAIIDFDRSEYYNVYVLGDGRVGFSTTPSSGSTDDLYSDPTFLVNDGNWHHIAAVYDGANKYIYIDGTLIDTKVNPHSGLPLGNGSTRYGIIGDGSEATAYNGSRNNFYYEGEITELRIWDEARSIDQINGNMGYCLTGSETNLAAYYKFDDGAGSSDLTDYSGNNHNGGLFSMNTATAWVSTTNDILCNCCESTADTVIATVFDIIDSNRFTISCPAIDSSFILLNAFGGTGAFDYRELSGEFSFSNSFSAGESRRKLENGGNYSIEIIDENGCLDTTASIVVGATPTTIASTTSSGSCRLIDRPEFAYIVNGSNEVIAGVRSSSKDLGEMTATVYIESNALVFDGDAHLGRHYTLNSDSTVIPISRVQFPLTAGELSDLVDSANATPFSNDDVSSIADLGVTKYNGPTEDGTYDPSDATSLFFLNQTTNGSLFGANYIQVNTFGFSEFWPHASETSAPLPVELLNFDALKKSNYVELIWSTLSELNNDYFSVERANNDEDFRVIGIVDGAGNSNKRLSYSFQDDEGLAEHTYYRIKQTDFDGQSTYTDPKLIKANNKQEQLLKLYPNPATNQLFIVNSFNNESNIEVLDSKAKVISRTRINNFEKIIELDISALEPGIYFIRMGNKIEQKHGKFIVIR